MFQTLILVHFLTTVMSTHDGHTDTTQPLINVILEEVNGVLNQNECNVNCNDSTCNLLSNVDNNDLPSLRGNYCVVNTAENCLSANCTTCCVEENFVTDYN